MIMTHHPRRHHPEPPVKVKLHESVEILLALMGHSKNGEASTTISNKNTDHVQNQQSSQQQHHSSSHSQYYLSFSQKAKEWMNQANYEYTQHRLNLCETMNHWIKQYKKLFLLFTTNTFENHEEYYDNHRYYCIWKDDDTLSVDDRQQKRKHTLLHGLQNLQTFHYHLLQVIYEYQKESLIRQRSLFYKIQQQHRYVDILGQDHNSTSRTLFHLLLQQILNQFDLEESILYSLQLQLEQHDVYTWYSHYYHRHYHHHQQQQQQSIHTTIPKEPLVDPDITTTNKKKDIQNIDSSFSSRDIQKQIKQTCQEVHSWIYAIQSCVCIDPHLCSQLVSSLFLLPTKTITSSTTRMITEKSCSMTYKHNISTSSFSHHHHHHHHIMSKENKKQKQLKLISNNSILDYIQTFLTRNNNSDDSWDHDAMGTSFILLVGPPESGKTTMCDLIHDLVIQQQEEEKEENYCCIIKDDGNEIILDDLLKDDNEKNKSINHSLHMEEEMKTKNTNHGKVSCIRPRHSDLIGYHVRSTMDRILALFSYAIQHNNAVKSTILILDDIDQLLGSYDNNSTPNRIRQHNPNRLVHALFVTLMDLCKDLHTRTRNILVLCTSCNDVSASMVDTYPRFDAIFSLTKTPADLNTRRLVLSHIYCRHQIMFPTNTTFINHIVVSTDGYSVSNLLELYRNLIKHDQDIQTDDQRRKDPSSFDITLQKKKDDTLSATEFLNLHHHHHQSIASPGTHRVTLEFPLHGDNAMEAWNHLREIIVTPLCYSNDLDQLLNHATEDSKARSKSITQRQSILAGVLITGPVGSGKTTLAQYCAAYVKSMNPSIHVLNVSCTSLVHKEIGGSERAVKRLFEFTRSLSPCILILDGIESIAAKRGFDNTTEGTMDRLLSTLLIEIDGIARNDGSTIAVIGITQHRSWVDSAVFRPGRLHDSVHLSHPDFPTRWSILNAMLSTYNIDFNSTDDNRLKTCKDIAELLACNTKGWLAAEMKSICVESVSIAVCEELLRGNTEIDHNSILLSWKHIQSALVSTRMVK